VGFFPPDEIFLSSFDAQADAPVKGISFLKRAGFFTRISTMPLSASFGWSARGRARLTLFPRSITACHTLFPLNCSLSSLLRREALTLQGSLMDIRTPPPQIPPPSPLFSEHLSKNPGTSVFFLQQDGFTLRGLLPSFSLLRSGENACWTTLSRFPMQVGIPALNQLGVSFSRNRPGEHRYPRLFKLNFL